MTLRYEVVPGEGLVARYADSIIWVGTPVDEQAWDALGAVLELEPGSDQSGADTAERLSALQGVLDDFPSTAFAALIVDGDHAQGILRGPVTVCNAIDVAPATGHNQFGVTVPFPMTEAVYVGFHQPVANPPKVAELLDLDAGVVPGAGAWVHPVAAGRRHSGAETAQDAGEKSQPQAPEAAQAPPSDSSQPPSEAPQPPSDTSQPPSEVPHAPAPETAQPPAPDTPAAQAMQPPAPEAPAESPSQAPAGSASPSPAAPAAQAAAGASQIGWPAGASAASGPPNSEPSSTGYAHEEQPAPATGSHQAQPQNLPPVGSTGSWARPTAGPSVAEVLAANEPASSSGPSSGFTPAADYERIDLRDAAAPGTAQPLPPIDDSGPSQSTNAGPSEGQSRGALVFDDGSTFALDRDYVVGRRPEKDPRVQSGAAEALTVVDPDSVLSSAHALISRSGQRTLLRDLGSLNGTHVAPPGATDWTKLDQHQEVPIVPGTRLLFGWTIATFTDADEHE